MSVKAPFDFLIARITTALHIAFGADAAVGGKFGNGFVDVDNVRTSRLERNIARYATILNAKFA